MVRTQVYFSEEQHRALRQAAEREGISMTALLRRIVERELLGRRKKADYRKTRSWHSSVSAKPGRATPPNATTKRWLKHLVNDLFVDTSSVRSSKSCR